MFDLRERRVATVALALALTVAAFTATLAATLVAGCSGGETAASSTTSTSETYGHTLVTNLGLELDVSWAPPEALPAEKAETISRALAQYGVQILLPSRAPVADAGALSACLMLMRTMPTNLVSVSVAVYMGEHDVLLSLGSSEAGTVSVEEWPEVEVRGLPGGVYEPPRATQMLNWEEGGMLFHAEWDAAMLSLEEVLAWLDSWTLCP